MGVAASMSLSVMVNGELWGLIACHHYEPKALTLAERVATEMFAEVFSLRIEAFERAEAMAAATRAREALDRIVAKPRPRPGSTNSCARVCPRSRR